jgi:hypothetical protein
MPADKDKFVGYAPDDAAAAIKLTEALRDLPRPPRRRPRWPGAMPTPGLEHEDRRWPK